MFIGILGIILEYFFVNEWIEPHGVVYNMFYYFSIILGIINIVISILVLRSIGKVSNIKIALWKYIISSIYISKYTTGTKRHAIILLVFSIIDSIRWNKFEKQEYNSISEYMGGFIGIIVLDLILTQYSIRKIGEGVGNIYQDSSPKKAGWMYFIFDGFYWLKYLFGKKNEQTSAGQFNQQYVNPQQGMQGGYVNQQYVQPQQMGGEQNTYANQQYTQPQQMNGQQNVCTNQQYAQPKQMNGQQNVYGNQQYGQTQPVSGQQNVYTNQQYAQPQQMSGERIENVEGMKTEEKLSVFGDKQVNVIRKEN